MEEAPQPPPTTTTSSARAAVDEDDEGGEGAGVAWVGGLGQVGHAVVPAQQLIAQLPVPRRAQYGRKGRLLQGRQKRDRARRACGNLLGLATTKETRRSVRICGLIISVTDAHDSIVYEVDDGTGTVNCFLWKRFRFGARKDEVNPCARVMLERFQHVAVIGTATEHHGMRQLDVLDLAVQTPANEMAHWMDVIMASIIVPASDGNDDGEAKAGE